MHSNIYLIIAGDGEERPQLEAYADQLGISNKITWTGFRQDIPRILAAIDIYIQTSLNEGLSLSILEAMAAGKPVIATEAGGNSEIINDRVNGLLITSGSVAEIVKAISDLMNHLRIKGTNILGWIENRKRKLFLRFNG